MYGKSYEAKKILNKKPKRPFPKEVVREIEAPEDLFSVLFAENIKEIKQKVKVDKHGQGTGKSKKAVCKKPSVSIVEENTEYSESEIENDRSRKNKSKGRCVNENKFFNGKNTLVMNKCKPNHDDSWFQLLDDDDDSFSKLFNGPGMKPFGPNQNCFGKYIRGEGKEEEISVQEAVSPSEKTKHSLVCSTPVQSNHFGKNVLCEISPLVVKDYVTKRNLKCTKNSVISNEKESIATEKNLPDDELSEISHFDELFISSFKNGGENCDKDVQTVSKLSVEESKGNEEENDVQHVDDKIKFHSDFDIFGSACNSGTEYSQDCQQNSSDENDKDNLKASVLCSSNHPETSEQTFKKHVSSREPHRKNESALEELSSIGVKKKLLSPPSIHNSYDTQSKHSCGFSENHIASTSNETARITFSPNSKFLVKSVGRNPLQSATSEYCSRPRKSHWVVPLTSWDTQSKRSSGFRQAHIASSNIKNTTSKVSILPDTSFFDSTVGSELQSPVSESCFSSRKSHVVVPLESWDTQSKQSTGFREVHIACTDNKTSRISISSDPSFSENERNDLALSFKKLVLQHCGQSEILNFSEEFPESSFIECTKVGEGAFGEVFSRQLGGGRNSVLKVIPVEGYFRINGEVQKKFDEILSEIVITLELSNLRNTEVSCTSNFPEMISCRCVQGQYPSQLLKLWEEYAENNTTENDSPEILPEDQIFIILELENVGRALEGYVFNSAEQSYSAFMQVTYALAVAETILEFEHRDLHWGNILIQPTKVKKINCKLLGKEYNIVTNGIKASVIDFTLSRMTFEGCSIFNNLADDPAIFEGSGDYQFDIYRLMKDCVQNKWQMFEPYTNVLWLSYVLDKLVTEVYYRNKTTKTHKRGMEKLEHMRGRILGFKSAVEVVQSLDN